MLIFENYIIGSILVIVTTIIHSIVTKGILDFISKHLGKKRKYILPNGYWIGVIVFIMCIASFIESGIWATAYIALGVLHDVEEAIYFSLVTFTTLGFGDVVILSDYRILASIEAATGTILFGWSTAIVIAVVQRLYFKSKS